MSNDTWDEYFIEGTNVLKNKLGITNKEELSKNEKIITLKKLAYLEMFPIEGKFDSDHLRKIHYFLFNDIYYFAGEYRKCEMARFREFVNPDEIEVRLKNELDKMNKEVKNILSIDGYSYFLAEEYYELMVIHPFREGNGRSVREFLREFVLSKKEQLPFNVELDFTKINPDKFLIAVKDKYLYPSLLQMLFKNALVKADVKEDESKHL